MSWGPGSVLEVRVRSEMSRPPPTPRANVCSRVSSSLCTAMATLAVAPGRAHAALSMPHLPRFSPD